MEKRCGMKGLYNLSAPPKNTLEERLEHLLKRPLSLTLTDNARSMISVRRSLPGYMVRLHHMFLEADESVLRSLAQYISGRNPNRVTRALRAYIKANQAKIKRPSRPSELRQPNIMPKGRHYHLQEAFERLNREYFQDRIACRITWGYRRKRPGRRTIRLGSYCRKRKIIRINPILDNAVVPVYVIEHIVYHEMLHHCLGVRKKNGRRIFHDRIFKKREQDFAQRSKARVWLKRHLPTLLT